MLIGKIFSSAKPSVNLIYNVLQVHKPTKYTVFSLLSVSSRQSWTPKWCFVMANSSSADKGKSGVNEKGEYVRKGGMFRDWITGKCTDPQLGRVGALWYIGC